MSNKEEIIGILDKNKVYTSYYARACKILPDRRLVSISIGIPDGFKGEIARELNPSAYLLNGYKSGKISNNEYKNIYYTEILSKLKVEDIYNKYKGKCLVCYCGKDSFCHRYLILEWLANNLGENIVGGEI